MGVTHCRFPAGPIPRQQSWPAPQQLLPFVPVHTLAVAQQEPFTQVWPEVQQLPPQTVVPAAHDGAQRPVFGSHMSMESGQQAPPQTARPVGQQTPPGRTQISFVPQQLWPHTLPVAQQVLFARQACPATQQLTPQAVWPAEQQSPCAAQTSPALQQALPPQKIGQQGGPGFWPNVCAKPGTWQSVPSAIAHAPVHAASPKVKQIGAASPHTAEAAAAP